MNKDEKNDKKEEGKLTGVSPEELDEQLKDIKRNISEELGEIELDPNVVRGEEKDE